jgi:hypothetical protein
MTQWTEQDEQSIRSFLESHPGYTVFGGYLYRFIDGDLYRGSNVVMYAQNHELEPPLSFEGTGKSVQEALRQIALQLKSGWGIDSADASL